MSNINSCQLHKKLETRMLSKSTASKFSDAISIAETDVFAIECLDE